MHLQVGSVERHCASKVPSSGSRLIHVRSGWVVSSTGTADCRLEVADRLHDVQHRCIELGILGDGTGCVRVACLAPRTLAVDDASERKKSQCDLAAYHDGNSGGGFLLVAPGNLLLLMVVASPSLRSAPQVSAI